MFLTNLEGMVTSLIVLFSVKMEIESILLIVPLLTSIRNYILVFHAWFSEGRVRGKRGLRSCPASVYLVRFCILVYNPVHNYWRHFA